MPHAEYQSGGPQRPQSLAQRFARSADGAIGASPGQRPGIRIPNRFKP
ncbi:hypothetical protein ThimaDRAFT_3544 [Thiocapsa marina 5811]|uniref:Uncharacterized protein n=1 Tax=Thiocapsa marina 5811 TaxID=768671 RepID=F9UF41_9GAMM|nr:hypothetical protein ThimaDRAFT_3544 [Thiocapsa marina 5811]